MDWVSTDMFRFWRFIPEVWHSLEHDYVTLTWSLGNTALEPGEYVIYEG